MLSHGHKRPTHRPHRRPRLGLEWLEDRCLLNSDPVNLGQFLQFRLADAGTEWTINQGVYSTTSAVTIGFNPGVGAFVPMLAIEKGVSLDTILNQFTISATPAQHNTLAYAPSGEFQRLTPLFVFQNNYLVTADTLVTAGITPGGNVLAPGASTGVTLNDVGSTLSPTALQFVHQGGGTSGPPELLLHGNMGLSAISKFDSLKKLLDKLNVTIGSSTDYYVSADVAGNVTLISKSGQGFYVDVTPNQTFELGDFASVTVVAAQFSIDTQNKLISLAGQFTAQFGDDSQPGSGTTYYFSLGTTADPGFVLDYSKSGAAVIKKLLAEFQTGQAGGNNTINTGGAHISLKSLFILYDSTLKDSSGHTYDAIGIGGEVDFSFGTAGGSTGGLQIILGDVNNDKAGLLLDNGKVASFNAEINGQFTFAKSTMRGIRGSVVVGYTASTEVGHTGTVTLGGTLIFTNPAGGNFTIGTLPGAPMMFRDGDWFGSIVFTVPTGFDGPASFAINPLNLTMGYEKSQDGHETLLFSGGVTLPKLWNATLTFNDGTQPGLKIVDGQWMLDGLQFSIQRIDVGGGVGFKGVSIDFERTNNGADWDLKLAGDIILPGGIEVDASLEIDDGRVVEVGVDFKATGAEPGIPLGDTGAFITEIGFTVSHPGAQDWYVEGAVGIGYGDFDGARLFDVRGQLKFDRNEFVIENAEILVLQGTLAKGSGSASFNWAAHDYRIHVELDFYDRVFTITGDIDVNLFNQVLVYIDASIRIPDWVPLIGGDSLFSVDGLLYVDPVVPDNDLLAAWIDWDLLFAHLRAGLEAKFHGSDAGLHFLWGDQVQQLEQLAQQGDKGYTATFMPTLSGSANQSLFTFEWDNSNEVGEVSFTIPGVTDPVVITRGDTTAHSVQINGNNYTVQQNTAANQANRFTWVFAADATTNPYADLPTGQYTVAVVLAEQATGKLSHKETLTPPQVTSVQLSQPAGSNTVAVTVGYGTGDPANTTVELYYTRDPSGGTGTRFDSFTLSGQPNSGTVQRTFDLNTDPTLANAPLQVWKQGYHVFARITDGTTSNSPAPRDVGGRRLTAPVSQSPVSPYVDLFVQVQITPDLPADQKPGTLAGWKVVWQEVDASGKPIGNPYQRVTDAFGQSGITGGAGRLWNVTVTPANFDGFDPIAAAGQQANSNGYLTALSVSGGTFASPNQVTMSFRNMVSVHGTIARDLTGQGTFTPGAGLAGYIVYNDLDNDGQLDPSEPHTQTGLSGAYDLRFRVPAAMTNYTIRLLPKTGDTTTYVQPNPDQPGLNFVLGTSYTVAVNPDAPQLPLFLYRDFLLGSAFVVSGVAYVSGPDNTPYQAGATPAANQTVWIESADQSFKLSTTTAADGSYSFSVPGAGRYLVYTDVNEPSQVNVPARHQFAFTDDFITLPVTVAYQGTPVTGFNPGSGAAHYAPWTASGNLYGDGYVSAATLGTAGSELVLVIYRGANLPDNVTVDVQALGAYNPQADPDTVPSVFAGSGRLLLVPRTVGGTNVIRTYDPVTKAFGTLQGPAANLTVVVAVAPSDEGDVFLFSSADGNAWAIVRYAAGATTPTVLGSFTYFGADSIRPVAQDHLGDGQPWDGLTSRWGTLAVGDFDGDGIDDHAFTAVGNDNRLAIGHLLSRERNAAGQYVMPRAVAMGGWGQDDPLGQKDYAAVNLMAVPLQGAGLSYLVAHRTNFVDGQPAGGDLLVLAPNPAPSGGGLPDSASTAFTFADVYPVDVLIGTHSVTDVNADGRPDVVLSMGGGSYSSQINVLVNRGDGRFEQPASYNGFGTSYLWAPLTVGGPTNLPGAPIAPPSFLHFSPAVGAPLSQPLVLANASFFSNSYWAQLNSPGTSGGYHFGFVQGGATGITQYSGAVFLDANGNGRQDPGEPNLPNQRLDVTLTNPRGQTTQQTLLTDAAGHWSLPNRGTWVQAVVSAAGLSPANTVPTGAASYQLTFVPGLHAGYDFGVQYSGSSSGGIQGIVFVDNDGSGGWTPGDSPFAGVTLFLDLEGDGQPDSGDPKAVTDARGGYRFLGLRPGNYVVRQVLPAGATQVFTSQPADGVDVEPGQTTYAINFGDSTSQHAADFNLDGHADHVRLVPLDDGSVEARIDYLVNNRLARSQVVTAYDPRLWRPVGVGDFNGDSHADVLWEDLVGGGIWYWRMRNGEWLSSEYLTIVPPGWDLVGPGDLDHAGTTDLIYRNELTGELVAGLMEGAYMREAVALGRLDPDVVLAGLADINGDGWLDLVLHDRGDGHVRARFLRAGQVVGSADVGRIDAAFGLVGASPWGAAAPAGTDLHWQDAATGEVVRWRIDYLDGLIDVTRAFDLGGTNRPGRYLSAGG